MDLWIRSQDKQVLRRCNSLKIEKWDDYYVVVEQATVYGKYKTKEIALKVLNDIEESINVEITNKEAMTKTHLDLLIKDAIFAAMFRIYDMPEDIEETDNHIPHMD